MNTSLIRRLRLIGEDQVCALAVRDGVIEWVGPDSQAEQFEAAESVDAAGATVTPAFVDAHVHTVQTGLSLSELDLSGVRSAHEALDHLASFARGREGLISGWGWDESTWSDPTPLTSEAIAATVGDRDVYLGRVDGHSAIVSPSLLTLAQNRVGAGADGRVERDAHHTVRDALSTRITTAQRLAAAQRALDHLSSRGVVGFHENAAPHIGPTDDLAILPELAASSGHRPTLYWGARGAFDIAERFGLSGLAGDLNADGALGSRTAALNSPYLDAHEHCGHAYLDADEIAQHVIECTRRDLQAGFHCIGEAALDAIGSGLESAAHVVGLERLRQARHRLEHVEMPSPDVIATLARCGVVASVQPVFDALWGGPDQMYAARVGERWEQMNPLRAMHKAGVPLAFGSDSPVTPVSPWEGVWAAMNHHNPLQRLDFATALDAHTRGGWHAAREDNSGRIAPGYRADLALWDAPGLGSQWRGPIEEPPHLSRLLSAGRTMWHEGSPRKVNA